MTQHEVEELTRLLIGGTSDGILAFDTGFRFTLWNPTMERISGKAAHEVVGRIAFEVFPSLVGTDEERSLREALAGRPARTPERELPLPATGRPGWYEAQYAPLHAADGSVIGGLGVVRDITGRRIEEREALALARVEAAHAETQAAAARFAFLARAGEALASSLDYEATLQHVAELALPILGDVCIVDIVEGQDLRRVATAHVVPAKVALLEELRRAYPASRASPSPAGQVLRSGQPDLLVEISPEVIAARTSDGRHAALIRGIGMRSHIAVPLVARGVTLGVIGLGISESDRRYSETDLSLAVDLARRAALAIDNALLYGAAQRELAERRRSESRFRATTEQSPLSIQILEKDGTTALVNRAWERLWGVTLDMIPDYNLLRDPQLEARGVLSLLRRAFAGERVELPVHRYNPEETLDRRSANEDPVRFVRTFAYPIQSPDGEVQEVALIQEDVTARVRAEERVRASEERLRIAMLGAEMNVWEWDLATDRIDFSENAEAFWGVPVAALADVVAVVHPDDRPGLRAARDRTASASAPFEVEHRILRDHETRWIHSRGRLVRRDAGDRILGVSVDVTQRKLAEAAARILADAGESLGASLDLRVTLANLCRVVVPRLADWCAIDLVGDAGELERAAVFHPDPARVAAAHEVFRAYPPRRGQAYGVWHVIGTGRPELVADVKPEQLAALARDAAHLELVRALDVRSFLCVPLVARSGTIGALSLAFSESDRRFRADDVALATDLAGRAAAAVENAHLYTRLREEDRRKDEFLATLAHELRNPLAPLSTGVALMKRVGDPRLEATRAVMERQLGHLVRLVDDLIDVSRVTRGMVSLRQEPIDVASMVATALEVARSAIDRAGLTLRVSLPPEPVAFLGDRTRIAQVLSNLLNNAAKYSVPGGEVSVRAWRDGDEVVFEVADTGIGIPREMQGWIFEMFVQVRGDGQREQGGLGIGLTLVRRLVELHGGRVSAESEGEGRGSRFTVRLPNVVEPQRPPAPATEPGTPAARRILVVDDNADALDTLATLLRLDGHDVRTATSGPHALEVVRGFEPEIALLDIGLPGMSGYDLARRLREDPRLAATVLVALTGWGQEEDRRQSREAGFDHHFTKPLDFDALLALLE